MELEFVQRWDDARLAFGNGANLSPTVRDYLNAMHHYKVHEMQNFLVMLFITHYLDYITLITLKIITNNFSEITGLVDTRHLFGEWWIQWFAGR